MVPTYNKNKKKNQPITLLSFLQETKKLTTKKKFEDASSNKNRINPSSHAWHKLTRRAWSQRVGRILHIGRVKVKVPQKVQLGAFAADIFVQKFHRIVNRLRVGPLVKRCLRNDDSDGQVPFFGARGVTIVSIG